MSTSRRSTAAATLVWLMSVIVLSSLAPTAQRTPSTREVASAIERELKSAAVPGASYAIVAGDRVSVGSFGVADLERNAPMRDDTLMQVGSLTKLITAIGVTSTLHARDIPITAPVGKQLADVAPRLAETTYEQLLSHTSGLRDTPGERGSTDERALAEGVRRIIASDFLLPAGVVFSYSNLGYAAAGAALERLHDRPFADALHAAALAPLKMRTATFRLGKGTEGHAVGHRLENNRAVVVREVDVDTSLWPAGYLWATAEDMSRVLQAIVDPVHAAGALSPSVIGQVTSPHAEMPNVFPGGHYGFGLMIGRERGTRIYEHGGTQTGFSSILRVAPDHRFGFVILANLDRAPLRRVAQVVMSEALRLDDTAAPARTETVVTPAEIGDLTGVYRNRGTAELAVRDGRVVLVLDGGAPLVVSRVGSTRYLARSAPDAPGAEFVLQRATASVPAYLHFGLWAFVARP